MSCYCGQFDFSATIYHVSHHKLVNTVYLGAYVTNPDLDLIFILIDLVDFGSLFINHNMSAHYDTSTLSDLCMCLHVINMSWQSFFGPMFVVCPHLFFADQKFIFSSTLYKYSLTLKSIDFFLSLIKPGTLYHTYIII